jgi:hypothetical protein
MGPTLDAVFGFRNVQGGREVGFEAYRLGSAVGLRPAEGACGVADGYRNPARYTTQEIGQITDQTIALAKLSPQSWIPAHS